VRAKLKLYTHNQVVQMPHAPKTRVLTPHATQLSSITSSCHCKCMCIIENRKRGTSRPEVWFAHTKTTRQADSGHLGISLLTLCRYIITLFSFFFSFLIFFIFLLLTREMRHKCHYSVAVNFHHDSMT